MAVLITVPPKTVSHISSVHGNNTPAKNSFGTRHKISGIWTEYLVFPGGSNALFPNLSSESREYELIATAWYGMKHNDRSLELPTYDSEARMWTVKYEDKFSAHLYDDMIVMWRLSDYSSDPIREIFEAFVESEMKEASARE